MTDSSPESGWYGYAGRILTVDLTERSFSIVPLAEKDARDFIGGRGLAVRLLWELGDPQTDALSPEAPLVFAAGPLVGTQVPSAARISLSARSPLTGTIFTASSSSAFGPRLKAAGFDAVVITGAADSLVAIEVDESGARVVGVDELAGLNTGETTEALLGAREEASAAVIASAGERLVPVATVMFDAETPVGRGGLGAVMGAKKLKGVVVSGTRSPRVARQDDFEFFSYEAQKAISAHPITSKGLPKFGTAMFAGVLGRRGLVHGDNYRTDAGDTVAGPLSGERLEQQVIRREGCEGCPVGCLGYVATENGERCVPGYETIWALGANLGIDDIEDVLELDALCRVLGLDAGSVGGTLATAIELAESGKLDSAATDHLPVRGDVASIAGAIRALALREAGFGELAAGGARALAEAVGAPEVAMHVKGLEIGASDPRGMQGQGLGLATSNWGGCAESGDMLGFEVLGSPKLLDADATHGKAGFLIVVQHLIAALDSLGVCPLSSFALTEEHYARLYAAVTGIETGGQALLTTGERVWNLERLYNLRAGFSADDDRLPDRLLTEPNASGRVVDLAPMLAEYYRFRGWDEKGVPRPEKVERLGLAELASKAAGEREGNG